MNQAPRTFLDKMRLETGGNFVRDFASALGRTRIVVVLVSAAALDKMTTKLVDLARDVRLAHPSLPIRKRARKN